MPTLKILLSDDPNDPDFVDAQEQLKGREMVKGEIAVIGALPKGMAGGRTSVYLNVEMRTDGSGSVKRRSRYSKWRARHLPHGTETRAPARRTRRTSVAASRPSRG